MGQNTKKQKSALVNQTEHTLELRCVDCDAWVRWTAVRRGAGRSAAQSDYTVQLVTAAMQTCVCVCVCVCRCGGGSQTRRPVIRYTCLSAVNRLTRCMLVYIRTGIYLCPQSQSVSQWVCFTASVCLSML